MDHPPTTYTVSDAKDHFSELLDRAEAGEQLTITRHGKPVAILTQPAPKSTDEDRRQAREAWIRYRDAHNITLGPGLTIKDLVNEGRK